MPETLHVSNKISLGDLRLLLLSRMLLLLLLLLLRRRLLRRMRLRRRLLLRRIRPRRRRLLSRMLLRRRRPLRRIRIRLRRLLVPSSSELVVGGLSGKKLAKRGNCKRSSSWLGKRNVTPHDSYPTPTPNAAGNGCCPACGCSGTLYAERGGVVEALLTLLRTFESTSCPSKLKYAIAPT
jgi:hypothetical protein